MLGLSKKIVDEHVVGPLKGASPQKAEPTRHAFIAGQIDARNNFQRAAGRNLGDDRRNALHVRQFPEHSAHLDRHRGSAESANERRPWRPHQDVGSNARCAGSGVLHQPQAQPHDQQDQCHFQRHGHDADQRPDWPVHQIPDNHAIHHVFIFGQETTLFRSCPRHLTVRNGLRPGEQPQPLPADRVRTDRLSAEGSIPA